MAKLAPDIERFRTSVLVKIYSALVVGGDIFPDAPFTRVAEIASSYDYSVGNGYVRMALEQLENQEFVETNTINNFRVWKISEAGVSEVQSLESMPDSFIFKYFEKGDDWLFEDVPEKTQNREQTEESQNDLWEPLEIDRDSPEIEELVEKLEELVELTEADNGYAANEPDERNFIVSALQTGLKALKEQSVIYRMQFKAFIWEPLTQLVKRFGNNAIGVAAGAAKGAIKDWLKDRINDFL